MPLNKKLLSERDICTKYITPALEATGWNKLIQLLKEVFFTDSKINLWRGFGIYSDTVGKSITTSMKYQDRQLLSGKYDSFDVFQRRWNSAERKQAHLEELEEHGAPVEILRSSVDTDVDLIDLFCPINCFDKIK